MGDRGNIIVVERDFPPVVLYTHWRGRGLKDLLQIALRRKQRWDDAPYLTRIIFSEMIKGSEADETGFGISTTIVDNEHKFLVVDTTRQKVCIYDCPDFPLDPREVLKNAPMIQFTFTQYCKADLSKYHW